MEAEELNTLREKLLPRATELLADASNYGYAVALTADGRLYDRIGNLDTSVSLANKGYIVIVNREEPDWERAQRLVSNELDLALDCFGAGRLQAGGEAE